MIKNNLFTNRAPKDLVNIKSTIQIFAQVLIFTGAPVNPQVPSLRHAFMCAKFPGAKISFFSQNFQTDQKKIYVNLASVFRTFAGA
jgi:hypothetical protein